jgi:serine/threonine protein phosphatase 1
MKLNSVLHLEKNKIGRDFVSGDIHGCFDDLEAKLKKVKFDKTQDRLFCVGDLIDRGPQSELVINYLSQPWFFSVLGNHEQLFLLANSKSIKRFDYLTIHMVNGGVWAYDMPRKKIKEFCNQIRKLPLIIHVGNSIILHAALPAVNSLTVIENKPNKYLKTILWHRGIYPSVCIPDIHRVYVGHNIVSEPTRHGIIRNIDTGAFLNYWNSEGKLTVVEIEETKNRTAGKQK